MSDAKPTFQERDSRSGWVDCVEIDAGTADRISAFIDRIVTVNYHLPHKAPEVAREVEAAA